MAKKNIITFQRQLVYSKNPTRKKKGKTNLAKFVKKIGVYKIFEGRKLVYVGSSRSDLYKTILRHFQHWNDAGQPERITYRDKLNQHKYKVEISMFRKDEHIFDLEKRLIKKHKPRDNKFKNYKLSLEYEWNEKDGKECINCYQDSIKDKKNVKAINEFSYNDSGELLDANGDILF